MISVNGIAVSESHFPDGTFKIKLKADEPSVLIEWIYENESEVSFLYMINSHIMSVNPAAKRVLRMPYIPNARMDRVKSKQEVFTLKYFCSLINSMKFNEVLVRDAHSSVALALIENVKEESVKPYIEKIVSQYLHPKRDIIFYPDEGACKRYSGLIDFPCVFGVKDRDWSTGEIKRLDIVGETPHRPFNALIVDDISSYGGTFFHSAKKLKEAGAENIYLYVTHCENNILKGHILENELVSRIFTTKSIFTKEHPLIEVMGGNTYA